MILEKYGATAMEIMKVMAKRSPDRSQTKFKIVYYAHAFAEISLKFSSYCCIELFM